MNSTTKFDPKLHPAQLILSFSVPNDLRSAEISIIDKFLRFSVWVSLCCAAT